MLDSLACLTATASQEAERVSPIDKANLQFLLDLHISTQGSSWGCRTGWDDLKFQPEGCYGIKLDDGGDTLVNNFQVGPSGVH